MKNIKNKWQQNWDVLFWTYVSEAKMCLGGSIFLWKLQTNSWNFKQIFKNCKKVTHIKHILASPIWSQKCTVLVIKPFKFSTFLIKHPVMRKKSSQTETWCFVWNSLHPDILNKQLHIDDHVKLSHKKLSKNSDVWIIFHF